MPLGNWRDGAVANPINVRCQQGYRADHPAGQCIAYYGEQQCRGAVRQDQGQQYFMPHAQQVTDVDFGNDAAEIDVLLPERA